MNQRTTWDLAVDGSPKSKTLMSPRSLTPSGKDYINPWITVSEIMQYTKSKQYCMWSIIDATFRDPPNKRQATAFFTFSWPNIEGAILEHMFSYALVSDANFLNSSTWKRVILP